MEKILSKLKQNWILIIIVLQPILDIISYFQSKYLASSYSWIIRLSILFVVAIIAFIKSKNKKKLILYIMPFAIFFILHMVNLYRVHTFNLIEDTKYFILVFQMPILCILLIDYIKSTNYDLNKLKNGFCYSFIIIAISIFLSYITNTYQYTYLHTSSGITGWFSSANTISMILCALAPWILYMSSNFTNIFVYSISHAAVFILLYTNATRSCYLTLLASLFVLLFAVVFSKNEAKKLIKMIITSIFIFLSIFAYKFSFTFDKESDVNNTIKEYTEDIKTVATQDEPENINFDNIDTNDDDLVLKILNTSYLYTNIIDIQGEKAVVDAMKPHLSSTALSNNRLSKVINAKIEFNKSDKLTKFLGIGYSRISAHELDLENDLQAIYYYYGYLGFSIYIIFILYFIIKAAIAFFKNTSLIHNKEYLILLFLIALLVAGGEYSGAFLRKSNANIYLSLYLVLLYFNILNNNIKQIDKKKITFLLLHLGYGGIETATINTANALSEEYNIELISFYNLKDNQEKYINKNIKVKHLYNGAPNKEEFLNSLSKKNIIKIIKEGFKSLDILIKKKVLIKKEILASDSFAIISTRYAFSTLLSTYGGKNIIKIAQEHHHHNNNKNYINILKHKYINIDYLFALTEGLKKDYENFLQNNKHTKVVLVPNMLNTDNDESSDLKSKNIISISRLDDGKKINELIDIFSKLENKNTKLYIIGDGKEKENLENQVENLKLQDRIIFTGYLDKDDQKKYLLNSSIYAMTSISEALPMILLEAMNYGIPCIAYKTDSGVSDIIENNNNGFIIENRNQKEYIEKLNTLLSDDNLKLKMKNGCIKTCKKYSKSEILKIWNKILKQVL